MARQLRMEYPGALYHLLDRGDRGRAIFCDEGDRQDFLDKLGEVCARTGWQVHAYCLMKDHFHLVVETPRANLSAGMKWLLGAYANSFQHRHHAFHRLFGGRYKSMIIDGSVKGHLRLVCDYVHLSPVRAKQIGPRQSLQAAPWSSYPQYLKAPRQRPPWLQVRGLLAEMGIPADTAAGRREFARQMEQRRHEATAREWERLRRGWYLGDKTFRRQVLALGKAKLRPAVSPPGLEKAADEKKALRIFRQEIAKLGWTKATLAKRLKGDPHKLRIAQRLRRESSVTMRWICDHLRMGMLTALNARLYQLRLKARKSAR